MNFSPLAGGGSAGLLVWRKVGGNEGDDDGFGRGTRGETARWGESKVASPRGSQRWEQKVEGTPRGERDSRVRGAPKGTIRKLGGPERKRLSERGNPKGAGTPEVRGSPRGRNL